MIESQASSCHIVNHSHNWDLISHLTLPRPSIIQPWNDDGEEEVEEEEQGRGRLRVSEEAVGEVSGEDDSR